MADKKDIGKAFKEKLKSFDQYPSKLTWEEIESKLPKKEKYTFLYWIRATSIFILLLLLLFFTYDTYKNSLIIKTHNTNTIKDTIIVDDCKEIDIEKNNGALIVSNEVVTKKAPIPTKPRLNTNTTDSIKNKQSLSSHKNFINSIVHSNNNSHNSKSKDKNTNVAFSKHKAKKAIITEGNDETLVEKKTEKHTNKVKNNSTPNSENTETLTPQTSSVDIAEHEEDSLKTQSLTKNDLSTKHKKDTLLYMHPIQKKLFQKFSLALHIIPTYTIPLRGSLVSNVVAENNKTGRVSLSYGLLFKTFYTDKIALRIGYNRLKLNNTIKNIQGNQLRFALSDAGISLPVNQTIEDFDGIDLIQKTVYNEISFGLQYEINKKQISTSLITGLNFSFLNSNSIKIKTPSNNFIVQGDDNLKKVGFSINLGSNFQYKLSKKLFLNVEPLINYQLKNASKNSKSYRHLYLTIQTGVSYKF